MKIRQRTSRNSVLVLAAMALSPWLTQAQNASPAVPAKVARLSASSVWNPSPDALAAIRAKCGEGDPSHLESCFLSEMKAADASSDALAFSRGLAPEGVIYMRAYRKVARVNVAYIEYAFRANELDGVFLVNGDPSPIDVDDESRYPTAELQKFGPYAALVEKYPNVSIWPGDRTNPQLPKLDSGGWGRQIFLVDYILRDGCHACAQVGTATFSFAFDTEGQFQGAHVSAVVPTTGQQESTPAASAFGAAGVDQIRVLAGKEFSVTLTANHTTGYSWRLTKPLEPAALTQVSNTYTEKPVDADSASVGAPGEEVWTFTAVAPGTVELDFEYVRPFEKDSKPVRTAKFLVITE